MKGTNTPIDEVISARGRVARKREERLLDLAVKKLLKEGKIQKHKDPECGVTVFTLAGKDL